MSAISTLDTPAQVDYVIPAEGKISISGGYGQRLLANELDMGSLRPWVEEVPGRPGQFNSFITRNRMGQDGKMVSQRVQTHNDTNATLRFLDWIQLDEAVLRTAKPRLGAAKDLIQAGLVYSLPNGIAKSVMQYQKQSDISGATMSMDGLRESEGDRPVFSTATFPLPIIHKDFSFSYREIMESRTGYSPLDLTTAELAARRVAEQVEQLTLGSTDSRFLGQATYTYSDSAIYGYTNFPGRITYSITVPTTGGWIPANTVADVLAMKKASQAAYHYGPWMLYCGLAWDPYMDDDYKSTFNDMTLRSRLKMINGILDVKTLDYLDSYDLLLVQMSSNVVRMVKGMDITTIQWESHGGMRMNFKVMCVMLPQLRTDQSGNTGIVHGS